MKLIELSANKETFQTIRFNPVGLSLIIGSSGEEFNSDGTSNGVGKSLALKLVHFCLASRKDKNLADELPGWVFYLAFSINGIQHNIQRATDDSEIYLDGELTNYTALKRWLNSSGVFNVGKETGGLSFRSLVKRFSRKSRKDCESPVATGSETPAFALISTLFLLGLDVNLAIRKQKFKKQYIKVEDAKNAWKNNETLRDLFASGQEAKVRFKWLSNTIPEKEQQLDSMVVSENFSEVEKKIQRQTNNLRQLRKKVEVENFKEEGILAQLDQSPDITKAELLELYSGLETLFKTEALKHFQEVENFHSSLTEARQRRLSSDLVAVRTASRDLEFEEKNVGKYRDDLLKSIKGKTAFDEYRNLANEVAKDSQEMKSIQDFMNVEGGLEKQRRDIRDNLFNDLKEADEYLERKPEAELNEKYMLLTQKLYPQSSSSISIKNNEGENQVRFDLDVYLEASGSDGVSDAKILCFDWLIFSLNANNSMKFLWHDNRLFANVDAGVRAKWFNIAINEIAKLDKQYIATINDENYQSMIKNLSLQDQKTIEDSIVLRLSGDKSKNKLLGVQVDLPRD